MYAVDDGVWLIPSRGRVAGLEKLLARTPQLRRVVILDQDDPELEPALEVCQAVGIKPLILPKRLWVGPKLNVAFAHFPQEAYYGFLANDVLVDPQPGWERRLVEAVPDWGIAFPNDGIHEEKLPTHPVLSGDLVRGVGYIGAPGIMHTGLDLAWGVMGSSLGGRVYVPTVRYLHLHPCVGRAEKDSLHEDVERILETDTAAFKVWVEKFNQELPMIRWKRQGGTYGS